MGVDRDKYDDIEDAKELIKALEADGLVEEGEIDEVTGEPMYRLTILGNETFPDAYARNLSSQTAALWQAGMIEVEFHESDYREDMITLLPEAYDVEKVLALNSDQRETLSVIKKSFEKKMESDL